MLLRSSSYLLSFALVAAHAVARPTTPAANEASPAVTEPSSRVDQEPPPAAPASKAIDIEPPKSKERAGSIEPKAAEPGFSTPATFDVDPIADGALIIVAFGTALVLDEITSTGEIRPQQIASNFDRNQLLGIDRGAITATPDSKAGPRSNIGLGVAVAFAVIDPVLSAVREKSLQTGLVDAMLYAETTSLTLALTDMVKLAVRRPRPRAYIDAELHKDDPSYSNVSTDSALSFFSGHASTTASIGATATYLAFVRAPHSWRPWATLALASALTTFVSVERVRAGKHFPTDVLAGAIAGAGIGVIVPHLHRSDAVEQRRVWIGYAPADRRWSDGGLLTLGGVF
ncbi:MAG TPA: phosphatase PAP2 family protein [Polyangiaceae bacterium]|nr:phosphatase PAP2 family protein [Polyangiaceae bacterium]